MSLRPAKVAPSAAISSRVFAAAPRVAFSRTYRPLRFPFCGAKSSAASTGTTISPLGTKRC